MVYARNKMPLFFIILCFISEIAVVLAKEGPCFDFEGNGYLHFIPDSFDNSNSIHYSLKFKTTEPNGVLMYGHHHGDDEALFVRDGKLTYHLFNEDHNTGIGATFGGFFQTQVAVNIGEWVTAHVYRMWGSPGSPRQTGIMVEIGGQEYRHVDFLERRDISISPIIYIGGFKEQLSSVVGYFNGQMKDIREEKNDHVFSEPSLNYMSKVGRSCVDDIVIILAPATTTTTTTLPPPAATTADWAAGLGPT